MLIRHIFLGFCGLAAGVAVSAGTFAFLIDCWSIIARMIGKANRAAETLHFENAVICGGIDGNDSVGFSWYLYSPWSAAFCVFYGLSAGIFVGCIAVALAEILDTFPITFRRMHIKEGLSAVMLAMAFGKCIGSFLYFFSGYFLQGMS